jgi:hypothetical protein
VRGVGRGALALFCVVGVPVLVLGLVRAFFGVSISAYRPLINDEVAYWHQALTFSHVGFNGGFYTVDEITNRSGLTPFGPHGPGFAVLYGSFGSVFGWHRHTAVILNLAALGCAAWVWVTLGRLSAPRLVLSGLLLVTFSHVLFWAPTGMQESLHHSGAIVMASCFASVLGGPPRRSISVFGWIVVGALSFIRPSWLILVPLWAFATARHAHWPVTMVAIAGSLLYGAAILIAYGSTTAPYGTGFFFLRAASLSLGVQAIVSNVASNLERLAMSDQFHPIELLLRYQYLALLIATGVAAATARTRWGQTRGLTPSHFLISATAMAAALAAMLLLYQFTNYAEHRVLSAFLLFGALVCLAAPGRVGPLLVVGIVLSNVASAPTSLVAIEDAWHGHFVWDRRGLFELEQAIDGTLVYQPGASRWCNTLLTSQYPPHLIAVPAGIGLSVLRKPELMSLPPRSRYIFLDEPWRAVLAGHLNLDPVATLPYGTLYVNRDAKCE